MLIIIMCELKKGSISFLIQCHLGPFFFHPSISSPRFTRSWRSLQQSLKYPFLLYTVSCSWSDLLNITEDFFELYHNCCSYVHCKTKSAPMADGHISILNLTTIHLKHKDSIFTYIFKVYILWCICYDIFVMIYLLWYICYDIFVHCTFLFLR